MSSDAMKQPFSLEKNIEELESCLAALRGIEHLAITGATSDSTLAMVSADDMVDLLSSVRLRAEQSVAALRLVTR